jgi:hypothetical protein
VQISSHLKRKGKFQAQKKKTSAGRMRLLPKQFKNRDAHLFLLFFAFGKAMNQTKKSIK